ncbi:MAG: hypothetical protein Q9160_002229 [Pyrenula sp. 1 TL-2023]
MSNIKDLAQQLLREGPVKSLSTSRRIRIRFNGEYILDTTAAKYIWEHDKYPQFYVPWKALKAWKTKEEIAGGEAAVLAIKIGDKETDRVLAFSDTLHNEKAAILAGLVRVEFGAVDQYYEEDTPIYVHPRDPFKRIEILHSTRPVKVFLEGTLIASTTTSYHLYETSLPCRYYIPSTSISDWSLLQSSATRTQCPYKGEAEYYSIVLPNGEKHNDLVWYYDRPLLECTPVTGMLCFYNEKMDIELDGRVLERPKTFWS